MHVLCADLDRGISQYRLDLADSGERRNDEALDAGVAGGVAEQPFSEGAGFGERLVHLPAGADPDLRLRHAGPFFFVSLHSCVAAHVSPLLALVANSVKVLYHTHNIRAGILAYTEIFFTPARGVIGLVFECSARKSSGSLELMCYRTGDANGDKSQ